MKRKHLLKIRDKLCRFWILCEDSQDLAAAQEFRRRLHESFGLSDSEWMALRSYLTNYDAFGVAAQRDEWLIREYSRLKTILEDNQARPYNVDELSRAYRETSEEIYQNFEVCRLRVELIDQASDALKHTPIWRAIYHARRQPGWHLSAWLRLRCVETGGCCGRSCQCCQKLQDTDDWAGHCTPACGCCMEHQGIDKLIGTLEDPIELSYSLCPSKEDTFSQMMMKSLIWNPFIS